MSRGETQLNIVVKLTASNGWRREWDIAFRSGVPTTVMLSQFSPENTVSQEPRPILMSFEQFHAVLAEHWPELVNAGEGTPE